jgi:chromosome partitioning protein
MFTVVVVNSKGGAGKTTLATNLASYYAKCGYKVALKDYDSQGSSGFWQQRRGKDLNPIQIIPMYKDVVGSTASYVRHPQRGTDYLIIDSPSGIDTVQFKPILEQADAILVPVLPSSIDIHAVSRFIAALLLKAKVSRQHNALAVIANRAKKSTLVYRKLEKFLQTLGIPFIATLRDTQNYIKASEAGMGVMDMSGEALFKDHKSWEGVFAFIENLKSAQAMPSHCSSPAHNAELAKSTSKALRDIDRQQGVPSV